MESKSPERLLITGASGYLASRLVPVAAQRCEVVAVSRTAPTDRSAWGSARWEHADLLDGPALAELLEQTEPNAIINAAAANPGSSDSFVVNEVGATNLATAAAAVDVRLVHVSSDIVHSGNSAPYGDTAAPEPINEYGQSKADGEGGVLAACSGALVVRTSLIYGLAEMDRGTRGFADRLEAGEELSLWDDAMRQPVWIDALSDGLVRLALDSQDERGTMNLAGSQTLSRAQFGRKLLEFWGIDTSGLVLGSAADVAGQPLDLTMTFGRAKELGLDIPGVDEVLSRF